MTDPERIAALEALCSQMATQMRRIDANCHILNENQANLVEALNRLLARMQSLEDLEYEEIPRRVN